MAILTTSWQLLASKYLGNSYGDLYVRLYGKYSEQDIVNNRTYVYFQARAYFGPKNYIRDNQGTGSVSGSAGSASGSCTYITGGNEVVIATSEKWITHDVTGNLEVSGSAYLSFPNWGWSGTASATASLPQIPRQATLLSAPNFNDEENPTITYSNPAGDAVTALQACISWTGGDDIAYRDISKTGNSYTFELTDEERTALRKATLTGNSRSVKFYVTTVFGNTHFYSTADVTFSVINANPVLSPVVVDIGTHSTQLTGNNTIFIKGYSIADAYANAWAIKEASLTKESITCGNTTIHSGNAIFNPVESDTFTFMAVDCRGNTSSRTIVREIVNYTKLTCGINCENPTVDGDFQLTISGNYFNGSFGAVNNTLKVEYRFKVGTSGEWSEWFDADTNVDIDAININGGVLDISDGKYNIVVSATGLDYRTTYIFQARAADEVYTGYIMTAERPVRALPIFDWSDKDFNFNVPVFREGNPMGYYPIGGIYTSSDNTDPSELFGGTWRLMRRFYGGELLAYGTAWNSTNSDITCNANTNYGISDVLGGIFSSHLCNHMPDILTASSGTIWVQTKGVVGLVEATIEISGQTDNSGCYGIWFIEENKNPLPSPVILTGGGALKSINGYYSGNSSTYFYNVSDDDVGTNFFVNPIWQPYGGSLKPCRSGIKSTLQVKAYAKGKVTYMWERIA